MKSIPSQSTNLKWQLMALAGLVSVLLIFLGYVYYKYEEKEIRDDKYTELNVIAKLKINQILQWRNERLGDAVITSQSALFKNAVKLALAEEDNLTLKTDILNQLSIIKKQYGYDKVFLISPDGNIVLSPDPNIKYSDSVSINYIRKALEQKEVAFTDFYFLNNQILIDIIAPLTDNENKPIAALIFQINPSIYIYPLIQSWPTPGKTAETLLIRKDGDRVVYVNELRHLSNTALKLSFPITNINIPAVQAVLGQVGIWEGKDYRGIEVLSDLRPVPGTPWFMVSKIDKSEIFTELYYRAFIIFILVILLILLLGAALAWIYNTRQNKTYRELILAEKNLHHKENEFRTALYSIGDGIITTDLNGCVRQMNKVAEQLTGWSELNATGKKLDEVFRIINEGTRKTVVNPVEKVLREGLTVGLANHTLLISAEGKETPIADSGAPIKGDSGEISGVVLVFRDQLSEREAELRLRESEEKFRKIFEYSTVGKSITEISGKIKTNKAFSQILGYSEKEILNVHWQDITHPDDIEKDKEYIRSMQAGEYSSRRWEKRYIHKDGHIIWVDLSTVLQRNEQGEPLYFITTIQDISERKLADAKLKESYTLIRIAGVLAKLGGWNVNLQENRSYWSDEVAAIHEMPAGFTPLVKDGINFYAPEWRERITRVFTDCAQKGIPYNEEMEIITSSGKRVWVQTLGEAVKDENGIITKVQGAFQDITERKKSENALIESERLLRESQSIAHLGSYTWDLSTGIWNSSEILDEIFGIDDHFTRSLEGWKSIIHPDWQETMNAYVAHEIMHNHQRFDKEYLIIRQNDGQQRWVYGQGELVLNTNGEPIKLFGTITDISERKKAEESLRETNEYLENLFNCANAPIIVWDPSLIITRFNRAFEKLSGYKATEVIGKKAAILFPENKAESSLELIVNTSVGARWETVEIEILRKDGEVRIVLWNSANILDSTQTKITATIAQGNDITERKQAEILLRIEKERLRTILDMVGDPIFLKDNDHRITNANRAFYKIFGMDENSVIGHTLVEAVPETERKLFLEVDRKVLDSGITDIREEELTVGDTVHTIVTRKARFIDETGKRFLVGSIHDITERKLIEAALNRYTDRLQNLHRIDQIILQAIESPETIVQNALHHIRSLLSCQRASVGIFDFENKVVQVYAADVDGKSIVQAGMSMDEEMYGVVDILRQSRMEIVEDMSKVASPSLINKVLQAEGIQSSINVALISAQAMYGVLNIGWDTPRYINQEESDIVNEVAGQITIAIEQAHLLKKTKIHADELEQRVIQRTKQLELANKELEAFSYSVSHDLRAPLRHISGFISLFLENKTSQLSSEELEYLDVVVRSSEEMGKLIDALLSFSRLNRSELIKVQINTSEIINRVIKLFSQEIQSRLIRIDVGLLPDTQADRQLINQVWTNLISNAIKYTGKKEKAIIEIGGYCENNETVFFVKDNGAGFNMKYANKLFTVFQRLHKPRDFEGIGIGLANIHRIVSRHGGRCWAEGEINSGATFYFSLPDS